jgi:signal transduction histidine kinase
MIGRRGPAEREEDPIAISLASWLGGGSVFLVLIAVGVIAGVSILLLNHMVQQQALVRAQLAASSGREMLRRIGEDALSNVRVLAERPTLQRLIGSDEGNNGAVSGLEVYLRRFAETTGSDVAALLRGGDLLAQSGPTVDWSEINTAIQEQGERFLLAPKDGSAPIWGAEATLTGTDIRVVVLELATPARLKRLSDQIGASFEITNFSTYHAPPDQPFTPLHSVALANPAGSAAGVFEHGKLYGASLLISAQTGEVVALLDARLNGTDSLAAIHRFDWVLALTALLVAAIAGVSGVLYGRWLASPVVALRELAERIGRGDFSAAVPAVAPLEVDALAQSMDAMRSNLVELTETLRKREAEAQAVLSGVVEGVYAVDAQRRIRYANAQVARLLGRPQSEIVGQFCGDVLRPTPVGGERPCERNCPILAARSTDRSSAREMLCLQDGSTRSTIIQSAAPIDDIQVQILRDETDLEAARRARDGVLANISHEFRTPLAAQLASIELLRTEFESLSVESQRELIASLERGALRLMRLIDNLLESVRIEAGQLSIRHQPVDLAELIADTADLMAPLLLQRQLQLQVDHAGISAVVTGDGPRLAQVFVNLLANAVKFSPEAGTIHIGGQRVDNSIEVWVEDEGPGIASGGVSQIFERFQRGVESEPDAPGLGLGLWIVKSIIDRHGGSIRVERTAAGHTRFTLVLLRDTEDLA